MAKKILKTFEHFFSFLIIVGLFLYLMKHWDKFVSTLDATIFHIVSLSLFIIVTWALGSLQTIILMRETRISVGFFEGMFTLVAMALGNYLPMRLGTIIRMHYFKKVHNLNYSKFSGMYGARTLIMLITTGLLGFIGMVGIGNNHSNYAFILKCLYFLITIVSFTMYLLPRSLVLKKNGFALTLWSNFISGYDNIRKSKRLFFQMFVLLLLQYIVLASRLLISFDAIGKEVSPFAYLVIAPSTILISIISFTPGNLCLREWVIGILTYTIGIDFDSGIFAGTLDRAILMICTFIFGSISFIFIHIRINK